MPNFDGTGPMGQGPMTGGGRGYCAVPLTGTGRPFYGRGFWGRGGGRGWRHWYWATGLPGWMRAQRWISPFGGFSRITNKEDEIRFLKDQADFLKQQLEDIENHLREVESKTEPTQQE